VCALVLLSFFYVSGVIFRLPLCLSVALFAVRERAARRPPPPLLRKRPWRSLPLTLIPVSGSFASRGLTKDLLAGSCSILMKKEQATRIWYGLTTLGSADGEVFFGFSFLVILGTARLCCWKEYAVSLSVFSWKSKRLPPPEGGPCTRLV